MSSYKPFNKSVEDIMKLWKTDQNHFEIFDMSDSIFAVLSSSDTPETVKEHIRNYLYREVSFDFMEYRAAIQILFSIACMNNAQNPFISSKKFIETLTRDSKKEALKAIKNTDVDNLPIKSISIKTALDFTKQLISYDNSDEINFILSHLVLCLAYEPDAGYRMRLADEITTECFKETMRFTKEHFAFLKKAVHYSQD